MNLSHSTASIGTCVVCSQASEGVHKLWLVSFLQIVLQRIEPSSAVYFLKPAVVRASDAASYEALYVTRTPATDTYNTHSRIIPSLTATFSPSPPRTLPIGGGNRRWQRQAVSTSVPGAVLGTTNSLDVIRRHSSRPRNVQESTQLSQQRRGIENLRVDTKWNPDLAGVLGAKMEHEIVHETLQRGC